MVGNKVVAEEEAAKTAGSSKENSFVAMLILPR
eukprot:CAMPEP_0184069442 /NCGR_PEP_ID=MMETSP0957-20130417/42098_1 /TAXON_ID=627963 /ORGANISM="Aplanochytrium sp, Strain PBS07" /LENGTH=32 /DNA_ID= /DNA_START= /DNA_END= /DNA_ORIENTATION=